MSCNQKRVEVLEAQVGMSGLDSNWSGEYPICKKPLDEEEQFSTYKANIGK